MTNPLDPAANASPVSRQPSGAHGVGNGPRPSAWDPPDARPRASASVHPARSTQPHGSRSGDRRGDAKSCTSPPGSALPIPFPAAAEPDLLGFWVESQATLLPCRFSPRGATAPWARAQCDERAANAWNPPSPANPSDVPSCFSDVAYCTLWGEIEAAIDWQVSTSTERRLGRCRGDNRRRRRRRGTDLVSAGLDLRTFRVRSMQPSHGVELEEITHGGNQETLWVASEIAPTLLRVGDFLSLGLDRATGPRPELQDLVVVPPSRMTTLWLEIHDPSVASSPAQSIDELLGLDHN